MCFNRIILVTHALDGSQYLPETKEENPKVWLKGRGLRGEAYNEPRVNMRIIANLLLGPRLSCLISRTGSRMITTSSKMLNPAPAATITLELTHFPFWVRCQTVLTGIHCRVTAMKNPIT